MITIVFFISNGWIEIPLIRRVRKAVLGSCIRYFYLLRSTADRKKSNSGSAKVSLIGDSLNFEEDSVSFFGQMENVQITDAQRRSVIATKFTDDVIIVLVD
jgi:hypothetical protein